MAGKVELKKKNKKRRPVNVLEVKKGLDRCNHVFQI